MLDKIKKIKLHRMKPEERFVYEIFTNLVEYYHPDYPNNRYYKYNDELLFNHNLNNGYFWCHHNKFWIILEEKVGLHYREIQDLVKKTVKEQLYCKKNTIPFNRGRVILEEMEVDLIQKKIEPLIGNTEIELEKELIKKELIPKCETETYMLLSENELIKKEIQPHATNNVEKHLELTKQLIKK